MSIINPLLKCYIAVTLQYADIYIYIYMIRVTLIVRREVGPVMLLLLALCSVYGTQGNDKRLLAMLP
jgi:hypothetical protein